MLERGTGYKKECWMVEEGDVGMVVRDYLVYLA